MTSADDPPRVGPITAQTAEQEKLLEQTGFSRDGRPLNIFATLAHHPLLLKRTNALGGAFIAHGRLPARAREIVILRVAAVSGSRYELAQHTLLGSAAGLTEEEIGALTGEEPLPADWSREELALVRLADELLGTGDVADGTWADLSERWTVEELIELVLLVGFYRMLAGFLRAFRVQLEPDLPAADLRLCPEWE